MQEPLKKVNAYDDDIDFDYSDEDEDEDLIRLAEERIKNDNGIRISDEEMWKKFGITDEDLEDIGEIEIE